VIAGKTVVEIDGRWWQVVHFIAGRESNLERVGIQRRTVEFDGELSWFLGFEEVARFHAEDAWSYARSKFPAGFA